MGPAVPSPRLIRFGVFELDLRSGELQKQGRKIRLEGQPVQILICLLENPGELVTREAFLSAPNVTRRRSPGISTAISSAASRSAVPVACVTRVFTTNGPKVTITWGWMRRI